MHALICTHMNHVLFPPAYTFQEPTATGPCSRRTTMQQPPGLLALLVAASQQQQQQLKAVLHALRSPRARWALWRRPLRAPQQQQQQQQGRQPTPHLVGLLPAAPCKAAQQHLRLPPPTPPCWESQSVTGVL